MELRQLEYFQMVSQLNNVTRAAEQLHVTQPSITVAIQKLEEELGVALFYHYKKRLILTDEGQTFLQHAEHILQAVRSAVQEMNDYKQLQKGVIKLGVPPMIGSYLFPRIFSSFQKRYPLLKLSTPEVGGSMAIRTLLEQNKLDMGIVIISQSSPLLNTIPIVRGEILVCLSLDHPLSHVSALSWELLRDQQFIMSEEGTYFRKIVTNQCKLHNFTPNVILSYNQVETVQTLVANGTGICFLADFVVRKFPNIIGIPLSDRLFFEVGLAWNKERHLSSASKALIEFIMNENYTTSTGTVPASV